LHASNHVIFAETHWTPGILLQAEDRVHRIGQNREVNVYYLLAKNTLDDKIWPMVANKLDVLGSTIDGSDTGIDFSADFRGKDKVKGTRKKKSIVNT